MKDQRTDLIIIGGGPAGQRWGLWSFMVLATSVNNCFLDQITIKLYFLSIHLKNAAPTFSK